MGDITSYFVANDHSLTTLIKLCGQKSINNRRASLFGVKPFFNLLVL